ncbi:heterokaryon incompatibility protein-domain-containing protein [Phaeosphaeriaceae sp. PMI808]|nr:heterokaryon incompatibility protein-domain-containing protein [Phaeosphaeriaceae sp. PMI808]
MEINDIPTITLLSGSGYDVDHDYLCPGYSTITSTQTSAMKGCPYCIFRCLAIKQAYPELPGNTKIANGGHIGILDRFKVGNMPDLIDIAWGNLDHEDVRHTKIPWCYFYDQELGDVHPVSHFAPGDTRSNESLETARKWIKTCDKEHLTCMQNVSSAVPRRLLDLKNNQVRLYETTSKDQGTRYACLSHCWGSPSKTLRATRSNYHDFTNNIHWDELPCTYQDAVSVVRRLGIDFLWIDSLCIIQNDSLDWERESGDMSNIYQNSYITLAAAASNNSEGGLYTQENPRFHQPGKPIAVARYPDGTERQLYARRKFPHKKKDFPLLSRGWVYQERVLSPRLLYFLGEEIAWECSHTLQCECGVDDFEHKFERASLPDAVDKSVSNVDWGSARSRLLHWWHYVIRDYTALTLTYSNDAFPALSGIAKNFSLRAQDEYVAGMWKSTLVTNLMWCFLAELSSPNKINAANHEWRAPSWSWVSAKWTPTLEFLPVTEELAEVKEVVCQPSGLDKTGKLATAYITIKGKALSACFKRCYAHQNSVVPQYNLHLLDDIVFSKLPLYLQLIYTTIWAGSYYMGLTDSRLENGLESLQVMVVQMTRCFKASRVNLHEIYPSFEFVQEFRSYILLAKQEDCNERWTRVGLLFVAEYEPGVSLFGFRDRATVSSRSDEEFTDADWEEFGGLATSEEEKEELQKMTKEEIENKLEVTADRNRHIFRLFDDTEAQEFTVW